MNENEINETGTEGEEIPGGMERPFRETLGLICARSVVSGSTSSIISFNGAKVRIEIIDIPGVVEDGRLLSDEEVAQAFAASVN